MQALTVVFDLDGTLIDTAPDLIGATNHVLERAGHAPVPGALLRPWISFGARRMIVEGLAASGLALAESDVDRMLQSFLTYYEANIARESRPYPGMVAAARALRSQGARLAVCTNKREGLSRTLLEALDLTDLFCALAGRDTFPVHKPHPDHLHGAIRMAGGPALHAVMVGDSEVDVQTARAAQVPVIAVSFGYTQVPVLDLAPDRLIHHYDELLSAVSDLVPKPP